MKLLHIIIKGKTINNYINKMVINYSNNKLNIITINNTKILK
jgi:hypothetical protein